MGEVPLWSGLLVSTPQRPCGRASDQFLRLARVQAFLCWLGFGVWVWLGCRV